MDKCFLKFHELVLQILFALETGGGEKSDFFSLLMRQVSVSRSLVDRAYEEALVVFAKRVELDEKIASISQNYDISRIQSVERSVLRLSFYELECDKSSSYKEVIAEALRLTRKFSTKEGTTFVNAILDYVRTSSFSQAS